MNLVNQRSMKLFSTNGSTTNQTVDVPDIQFHPISR